MILYQWSQGMIYLISVSWHSDCYGHTFLTVSVYNREAGLMALAPSSFLPLVYVVLVILFLEVFLGYPHQQSLLRWPTHPHRQQTDHSSLLYSVPGVHGRSNPIHRGRCIPAASAPHLCFNFCQLLCEFTLCGFYWHLHLLYLTAELLAEASCPDSLF
jgi:hypothetical protein